jgi:hypothetical protein
LISGLGAGLDPGELDLWAHAITREDAWLLCGPDIASLRFGVRAGCRDHLVSLESLLEDVGFHAKGNLRANYTEKWHASTLSRLVIAEGGIP